MESGRVCCQGNQRIECHLCLKTIDRKHLYRHMKKWHRLRPSKAEFHAKIALKAGGE